VVMYIVYICVFYRHTNHSFVGHLARNNHGDECRLPPTIHTLSILGKSFSFGVERIWPTCCHGVAFACCIMNELKTLT
jgi:hypothetical protein